MSVTSPTLTFSTIKKKSQLVGDKSREQQQKTLVDRIKTAYRSQSLKSPNITLEEPKTAELRNKHIISDFSSVQLKVGKKGKKSGKIVVRDQSLAESGSLQLSQSIHNKAYELPQTFVAETKNQYHDSLAPTVPKEERSKVLPWGDKELAASTYRISYSRAKNAQGQEPAQPVHDSAFYFNSPEEWKKVRDFLKANAILETDVNNPQHPTNLLRNLSAHFKSQITAKFAKQISIRAAAARREVLTNKEAIVSTSPLLINFNKDLLGKVTQDALNHALEKNVAARQARERREKLEAAVNGSQLLSGLDTRVGGMLLNTWKHAAEDYVQVKQEDINIVFNMLEITSQITQPILKLVITVDQNFPGLPKINGASVYKRTLEYTIKCKYDQLKTYNVYRWKLFSEELKISDAQRTLAQQNDSLQSMGALDDRFCIQFNDFELEYLDNVELKIMLFNETETLKAYHYATLKDLYAAAKNGNNIWFCMKLNAVDTTKFPLLNLRVKSQPGSKYKKPALSAKPLPERLEDTFYNYSFKLPVITPKHARIVDLCPLSWNIGDELAKTYLGKQQYSEFIKRIVHKLSKHYYQGTTRQVARLKKSAYIWAEIQDEIMTYTPASQQDQLYLTRRNLDKILETQKTIASEDNLNNDLAQQDTEGDIVSYLFKRDQWEVKPEWRDFFVKLRILFKKGISPQQRIQLWSEIGKSIYFVVMTEELFVEYLNSQQVVGAESQIPKEVNAKGQVLYQALKEQAEKESLPAYQDLEDDIEYVRQTSEQKKITFETHLRSICRTFIFWSRLVDSPKVPEKFRLSTTYSRAVLTLCQGLLTCQSCKYIEGRSVVVEEDQIFWLLVSITTYVLSNYFNLSRNVININKFNSKLGITKQESNTKEQASTQADSLMRSQSMAGIRSDLTLLRILLKTNEKDLYSKFEELGLSFEYYFADHLLTLFFNLFNPGLSFRIWDVLFFEGTGPNRGRSGRMAVCVLYALIKQCKDQLMEAKKSSDFKVIFELNAKFETKYGDFIKQVYNVYNTFFGESDAPKQKFDALDAIFNIKCISLPEFIKSGDVEKKLSNVEKAIEKNDAPIQEQNQALFNLLSSRREVHGESDDDALGYPVISRMVKELQLKTNTQIFESESNRLSKERPISLHIRVHNIKAPSYELDRVSVQAACGTQTRFTEGALASAVNFEAEIAMDDLSYVSRHLNIQVLEKNTKLFKATIDLEGLASNTVTKVIAKLHEENPEIYNAGHTASEIELTLLLETVELGAKAKPGQPFIVSELEEPDFKTFRKLNLEKTSQTQIVGTEGREDEYNKFSLFNKSKCQWKEKFALSYEGFVSILREIAPSWLANADLSPLYNAMVKANINKKFYLIDFFILLVSSGKFTINQKLSLLFDLVSGFDTMFGKESTEISSSAMKGLLSSIYDVFMIHIPQNELENMVDLAIKGHTCSIKKVAINGNFNISVNHPRRVLNRLSNFIQLYHNSREVHLYNKDILKMLKETYEKSSAAHPNHLMTARNELEIIYHTNGMSHKAVVPIDQDWKIIEETDESYQSSVVTGKLLRLSNDIISLQHSPYTVSKKEFIQVMEKMPLVNYLYSFEHIGAQSPFPKLKDVSFKVLIQGEQVLKVTPVQGTQTKTAPVGGKKRAFDYYLRNWDSVVRIINQKVVRAQSVSTNNNLTKQKEIAISNNKLNIHQSYLQLIQNIKKNLIKTISNALDKNEQSTISQFHFRILNEDLWDLDFDVTLFVDGKEFKVTDPKTSPFQTITQIKDQVSGSNQDVSSLQLVYSLKSTTMPDRYVEPYNQLARYRFADKTSEWLPCKLKYKFHNTQGQENRGGADTIHGYGVIFQQSPTETILTELPNVALIQVVDLAELEYKRLNVESFRPVKAVQSPDAMSNLGSSPPKSGHQTNAGNQYGQEEAGKTNVEGQHKNEEVEEIDFDSLVKAKHQCKNRQEI